MKKRFQKFNHASDQFWLVWCKGSGQARYQHYNYAAAQREAFRLAADNPGKEFFVMKAMTGFICPVLPAQKIPLVKMVDADFAEMGEDPDDIPF